MKSLDSLTNPESESAAQAPHFLIVIGRQYASGGRSIGRWIAEQLGVSFYDKRLLAEAADRIGFSSEMFRRNDEKRPSMLRSFFGLNYGSAETGFPGSGLTPESLYSYTSEVIRQICARESCVIVGRTADYVMRHHPRMASIFIHAPLETRVRAIISDGEADTEEKAAEIARKSDKERESYYNYFTNRFWGRADNYHLSIDSTRISRETLLAILREILSLPR